jgi:hypothetical protein
MFFTLAMSWEEKWVFQILKTTEEIISKTS